MIQWFCVTFLGSYSIICLSNIQNSNFPFCIMPKYYGRSVRNGVWFKCFVFNECCKHEQIITACFDVIFSRWFSIVWILFFFLLSIFYFLRQYSIRNVVSVSGSNDVKNTQQQHFEVEREKNERNKCFRINLVAVVATMLPPLVSNIRNENFVTCKLCACSLWQTQCQCTKQRRWQCFRLELHKYYNLLFLCVCIFLFRFASHTLFSLADGCCVVFLLFVWTTARFFQQKH